MVFSWFAHTGLYVTPVEARKEEKTKKTHFVKRGFFVVCPYGPLCHPCGSKEGGKNEKTTLCKTWFFRGLPIRASMSPLWKQGRRKKTQKKHSGLYVTPVEARKEEKTKKPHFVKRGFLVVCPYGPLCHLCGSKEGGKNEKTTLCKTWFFRGLAIRASMSPLWEARKEQKTKKPHFVKRCFFLVCPYGPLCHPCGSKDGGKNEKTTLCKTWFFRGLPIRVSMSPLWKQGRRKKRKKHTL